MISWWVYRPVNCSCNDVSRTILAFEDLRRRLEALFKREWLQGATLAVENDEDVGKDHNDIAIAVEGYTENVAFTRKERTRRRRNYQVKVLQ